MLKGSFSHPRYLKTNRAKALFGDLDHRFFSSIRDLPKPLKNLARCKATYEGFASQDGFNSLRELNPVLVASPWLFWRVFHSISDSNFLDLAEAGMNFVLASVLMDHIVDGQSEPFEDTVLLHQALYERGLRKYQQIYPEGSTFWDHQNRLSHEHIRGLSTEIEAQRNRDEIDYKMLEKMAYGKVSPIILTLIAFCITTDQSNLIELIERSLFHIAVASQLLDDIGDWEEDHSAGHSTYFLTTVRGYKGSIHQADDTVEQLQGQIDSQWLDVKQLELVIELLDKSAQAVSSFDCEEWVDYVNGYRERADRHAHRFTARHIKHAVLPLLATRKDRRLE